MNYLKLHDDGSFDLWVQWSLAMGIQHHGFVVLDFGVNAKNGVETDENRAQILVRKAGRA